MKGLILKDLYMAAKYCRIYFVAAIAFTIIAFTDSSSLFLTFYPCMLCGMMPVNLLGYDERSGWLQYSEALPYTRSQIVSAKYLIGLGSQLIMLIITAVAQAIRMSLDGGLQLGSYAMLMVLLVDLSLISSSICLPFMFKLGVEKGRTAYLIAVGLLSASTVLFSDIFMENTVVGIDPIALFSALTLISIGILALSWYLSIVFYKKREL